MSLIFCSLRQIDLQSFKYLRPPSTGTTLALKVLSVFWSKNKNKTNHHLCSFLCHMIDFQFIVALNSLKVSRLSKWLAMWTCAVCYHLSILCSYCKIINNTAGPHGWQLCCISTVLHTGQTQDLKPVFHRDTSDLTTQDRKQWLEARYSDMSRSWKQFLNLSNSSPAIPSVFWREHKESLLAGYLTSELSSHVLFYLQGQWRMK